MEKRIAGIDSDSYQIALAWVDGGGARGYFSARPPVARQSLAEHRFLPLMSAFAEALASVPRIDWAYIEKPMYTKNPASTIAQSAVLGGIRLELQRRRIPHSIVDPGTWKKGLGIGGRANKDEIMVWAKVNLDIDGSQSQDIVDALCIAHWGAQRIIAGPSKKRLGRAHASNVRQLSDVEAAWIAAMIDAAGTISWTQRSGKNRLLQVAVSNTSEEIISTCLRLVGDGVSGGRPGTEGILPVWVWHLANGESLKDLLPRIIPYLASKRDKAEEVLAYLNGRTK